MLSKLASSRHIQTASFRPEHRRFWRCGVEKPLYFGIYPAPTALAGNNAAANKIQGSLRSLRSVEMTPQRLGALLRDHASKARCALYDMTIQKPVRALLRDDNSKPERTFKTRSEICRYTLAANSREDRADRQSSRCGVKTSRLLLCTVYSLLFRLTPLSSPVAAAFLPR
jgi:hypothetical protein